MKCTEKDCKVKVKDNTQYSIHMNKSHRGSSYSPLDFDKKSVVEKSTI